MLKITCFWRVKTLFYSVFRKFKTLFFNGLYQCISKIVIAKGFQAWHPARFSRHFGVVLDAMVTIIRRITGVKCAVIRRIGRT